MRFIVYNMTKEILRSISCSKAHRYLQAKDGEFVMKGTANDVMQKVEFDGLDDEGQPVNPRIVNKTPEEIEAEKPKEISFEKQPAFITNEQWQDTQDRLALLEST